MDIERMTEKIVNMCEYVKRMGAMFERMKNCANCAHSDVCVVVARRKATRANDYSPCSNWMIMPEDEK